MSIDKLPYHIVLKIIRHTTGHKSDFRNFRIVCKRFASISREHLDHLLVCNKCMYGSMPIRNHFVCKEYTEKINNRFEEHRDENIAICLCVTIFLGMTAWLNQYLNIYSKKYPAVELAVVIFLLMVTQWCVHNRPEMEKINRRSKITLSGFKEHLHKALTVEIYVVFFFSIIHVVNHYLHIYLHNKYPLIELSVVISSMLLIRCIIPTLY